jgi:hypothetical protein
MPVYYNFEEVQKNQNYIIKKINKILILNLNEFLETEEYNQLKKYLNRLSLIKLYSLLITDYYDDYLYDYSPRVYYFTHRDNGGHHITDCIEDYLKFVFNSLKKYSQK